MGCQHSRHAVIWVYYTNQYVGTLARAMNTPLSDNFDHSNPSPLDGLMQSLGLDSHQHGDAQYPDSHLGDPGQLHPPHHDLFNSGYDSGQPAHHRNSGDSGIPDFTSSWGDSGAFAFNDSAGGHQTSWNDAHPPDSQNYLSYFSNFDPHQQPSHQDYSAPDSHSHDWAGMLEHGANTRNLASELNVMNCSDDRYP